MFLRTSIEGSGTFQEIIFLENIILSLFPNEVIKICGAYRISDKDGYSHILNVFELDPTE